MGLQWCTDETCGQAGGCSAATEGAERMRILIAGLVTCVAGCSSYDNGPLGYSKRGPIERAQPASDHNSLNARTTPMLGPSR